MQESSLRILAQAGLSGVFFAAKILRGELPHYRLPLPEFAAKILPCSAPLTSKGCETDFEIHGPEPWIQICTFLVKQVP